MKITKLYGVEEFIVSKVDLGNRVSPSGLVPLWPLNMDARPIIYILQMIDVGVYNLFANENTVVAPHYAGESDHRFNPLIYAGETFCRFSPPILIWGIGSLPLFRCVAFGSTW